MPRPFLRSSIEDLAAAFKRNRFDMAYLRALDEELRHRKTRRAAGLRAAVQTHLKELERDTADEDGAGNRQANRAFR